MAAPNKTAELEKIARRYLELETLEMRRSDSLDFKEQSVWSIRAALEAAYEAGYEAAALARKGKR